MRLPNHFCQLATAQQLFDNEELFLEVKDGLELEDIGALDQFHGHHLILEWLHGDILGF